MANGAVHGQSPEESGFRSLIAIVIAVTSVIGALAAWRASVLATEAAILNRRAIQERIESEMRQLRWEGQVDHDVRLLADYQEHIWAWRFLGAQAERAQRTDAQLAASLDAQAQGELALARALRPFFLSAIPDFGNAQGTIVYDRAYVLEGLLLGDATLRDLRPAATLTRAETFHAKAAFLRGIVALFVAALFFLTLGVVARIGIRRVLAQVGAAVIAATVVLWGVAEALYR